VGKGRGKKKKGFDNRAADDEMNLVFNFLRTGGGGCFLRGGTWKVREIKFGRVTGHLQLGRVKGQGRGEGHQCGQASERGVDISERGGEKQKKLDERGGNKRCWEESVGGGA